MNIYDFMQKLPIVGYEGCIDALTVTSTGLDGKLSIAVILHELEDSLIVEPLKPFKFQGARGWSRGSVRYADKRKEETGILWAILMVTGKDSERSLKTAIKVGGVKFTRVDVAIDVKMSEKVIGLARKLKDGYKGGKQVKLIESLTGDTFYCGSRESDMMVRIYDKSEEYNENQGMVWRFEVEFKGGRAEAIADYIAMQGKSGIPDLLWTALQQSHLPAPIWGQTIDLKSSRVTMASSERKLAWLGEQVKPTVRWLQSLGKETEVLQQLGLPFDGKI